MITYKEINQDTIKITELGYLYFLDREHPLSTGNSGRVLYHRHIMSMSIGRWLHSNEIVHHIDENKLNNNIDNLVILSRSEHTKEHMQKYKLHTKVCPVCMEEYQPSESTQKYCSNICCTTSFLKTEITKEELEALMINNSWSSLGRLLNYSDNGIKKRAKALGCDLTMIKTSSTSKGRKQIS